MSVTSSVDAVLTVAKEKEGAFDWLGAAECYKNSIASMPETEFSNLGRLNENLGYALVKARAQLVLRRRPRVTCLTPTGLTMEQAIHTATLSQAQSLDGTSD